MDELSNMFGGAEQLWQYITRYAAKAGREATRIVLELYYVVKSPNTPALDKTIIIAALGYQLLPNDLMSNDKYKWLSFLDNGAALALAYSRVKHRLTPQIKNQVNAVLEQWFGVEYSQSIGAYADQNQRLITNEDSDANWDSANDLPQPVAGYDENEDVVID